MKLLLTFPLGGERLAKRAESPVEEDSSDSLTITLRLFLWRK